MKEDVVFCKSKPFTKWSIAFVALLMIVVAVALIVSFVPVAEASIAIVKIDGKAVATLRLSDDLNPVANYRGVIVRAYNGAVETVYQGQVASEHRAGKSIVYPTLGVEVELAK